MSRATTATTASRKRPRAASFKCWLMKSEPDKFSIDQLKQMTVSPWDGVRNYAARNHMMAMREGDRVLFYHSNCKEPGVVGLATVAREYYDDYTALDKNSEYYFPKATKENNPWKMVDVKFVSVLDQLVSLKAMKEEKKLKNMALFTQSRLSVQPVTIDEYEHIVALGTKQKKGKKVE